ncbi:putative aspartate aminotransferase YhdR [Candidatus Desulfarcum epimagneticum]|uniref:Aminotransferase n=1 Tax=uncultured Desulfobacteraceae bacterium TaxID=218296 RepID=A0A484HIT2_9BACT|nr:putative aspartate aminotransferase YhdR [uncultured Desulfobacteraceae bacterium]
MTIAKHVEKIIEKSSWIRKMFEDGARLKALHGAENVFDFSLGNPNIKPPREFRDALKNMVGSDEISDVEMYHGYMPNTGYPHVRDAVAQYLTEEQGVAVSGEDVIMTCGASGALNAIFKAILDPEDEVISPTPFFVEYGYYVGNHGGVLKTVPTKPDFHLDLDEIEKALTDKTKAVLINSPNNPSGQVYPEEDLKKLGRLLAGRGKASGKTIYLISDEPYRKIVYDGKTVPGIFSCYDETIMATSYSKDISIPGERIGFLAVSPKATHRKALLGGMAIANRILGFVNAPALMQRVVGAIQGAGVDISQYAAKMTLLSDGLADCGYEFTRPAGAFYLFPKSPIPDDVEFVRKLQEELILTVPGSGFGTPGHFRIAFCVDDDVITKALPGFRRAKESL